MMVKSHTEHPFLFGLICRSCFGVRILVSRLIDVSDLRVVISLRGC